MFSFWTIFRLCLFMTRNSRSRRNLFSIFDHDCLNLITLLSCYILLYVNITCRTFVITDRFWRNFTKFRSWSNSRNTTSVRSRVFTRGLPGTSLAQLHLQGCSSLIIRQLLAGILDAFRVPTVTQELPRISFINDKTINPLPPLNYECKCVFARRVCDPLSQHPWHIYACHFRIRMKIFYILARNVRV